MIGRPLGEYLDDIGRPELPCDTDGQVLTADLVNDLQVRKELEDKLPLEALERASA